MNFNPVDNRPVAAVDCIPAESSAGHQQANEPASSAGTSRMPYANEERIIDRRSLPFNSGRK